jgi:hypothetical protein
MTGGFIYLTKKTCGSQAKLRLQYKKKGCIPKAARNTYSPKMFGKINSLANFRE